MSDTEKRDGPGAAAGEDQPRAPAEGAGHGGPEGGGHQEPNYMGVWLGLFLLTVAEVGVAFLSAIPKSVIVVILLGLAVWKALLVALYYMHLRFEPKRLRLVVMAPLPLAVIMVLAILMEYR